MKQVAIRSLIGAIVGVLIAFGLAPQDWLDLSFGLADLLLPLIFGAAGAGSVPAQAGVRKLMRRSSALMFLSLLLVLPSCAALAGGGWKPIAKLGNATAQALCAAAESQARGISMEDASRGFCSTLAQLQPYIELATRAEERAVERRGQGRP